MKRLLAASVAAPALIIAASAWAQPYPEPYPPQGYDPAYDQYDDDAYDDAPEMPGYAGPDDPDGYGDEDMDDDAAVPPPEALEPDDDRYADSDYAGAYGAPGDQGAPQYQPYETVPPRARPPETRDYAAVPERMTPPLEPAYEAGIPEDLLDREDALERRIREGGDRGIVPPFHVDNLLVQLDSIRAQQDELASRDGGLNHTTRTFIESRLDHLEQNVTW